MDWERVRAHYARHFEALGATQDTVAATGQLSGQNMISKLLANHHKGPAVETFLRAVVGLGIPLSQFFAELEQEDRATALAVVLSSTPRFDRRDHESSPAPASVSDSFEHVVTAQFETLTAKIDRLARDLAAGFVVDRGPHDPRPSPRRRARHRVREIA